jgi:hypothetical protein
MFRAVLWRALALWAFIAFVSPRSITLAQEAPASPALLDINEPDDANVGPQPEVFEGDAWGDEAPNLRAGPLSFRMLLQGRHRSTFARHSRDARPDYAEREDVLLRDDDGFALQRVYLRIAAEPSPWLKVKTLIDLAKLGGARVSNVVKQAYVELRPIPERVELAVGVFKVPYSIIELDPVARYELSELGDTDDLIEALGFGGRDVGIEVMVAPLPKPKWLRVLLGTFRGHARNEQASPFGTLAARLESKPFKGLRIGVDMSAMPRATDYKRLLDTADREVLPDPPDLLFPREERWASGSAYSADISYSRHRFAARVEGLMGDRVDIDRRYGARSYGAAWALVAYRMKVGPLGVMPAARAEWLDLDRDSDYGGRLSLTLGVSLLYKKNVRLVIDVTHTDVQENTPFVEQPEPLPLYPYLDVDHTRLVAQLQVEI